MRPPGRPRGEHRRAQREEAAAGLAGRCVAVAAAAAAAWAIGLATPVHAGEASLPPPAAAGRALQVQVPSLDRRDGAPLLLRGHWFALAAAAPAPAVVLLHGCGGPHAKGGARGGVLSAAMREYAAWLNAEGVHALVLDSFSARGETSLCTQRHGQRAITQDHRRRDALGALAWLAARPEVDATRLGLLGWSHGGSAVLAATQHDHPEVAAAPVRPAFAVAFYPGCATALREGWQPVAPLLLLLGAADDWTPPGPCEALARRAGPAVQRHSYAGAFHGFDSMAPVRLRLDVPNGVHPGRGVHVGGDPAARAASREALQVFLRQAARPHRP